MVEVFKNVAGISYVSDFMTQLHDMNIRKFQMSITGIPMSKPVLPSKKSHYAPQKSAVQSEEDIAAENEINDQNEENESGAESVSVTEETDKDNI